MNRRALVKALAPISFETLEFVLLSTAHAAARHVREHRFSFTVNAKIGYGGELDDVFTNIDQEAQQIIIKNFQAQTPLFGIIAEEKGVRIACTHPTLQIYWKIDPIDGTKAYVRMASHGISVMISLVCNGVVIAVCILNVMTGEAYYYSPVSDDVLREEHPDFGLGSQNLSETSLDTRPLTEQFVLIRRRPESFADVTRSMFALPSETTTPLFKGYDTDFGSIGTAFARLWQGEVGAILLQPNRFETPWDGSPVIGISNKLWFEFFDIDPEKKVLTRYKPTSPQGVENHSLETIVVHRKNYFELCRWLQRHGFAFTDQQIDSRDYEPVFRGRSLVGERYPDDPENDSEPILRGRATLVDDDEPERKITPTIRGIRLSDGKRES